MPKNDDDFDPWAVERLVEASTVDVSKLFIETIEGIEPLDDQFGVHPLKTVPDAFYEPLFGQPKPTEAELEAAGGDPALVPPMQTYAILDAAKVFALVETLEASGLEHRCLFKGEAYDEFKDVAPWIVLLERENEFTRHLFSAGDAPWFLWDREPGIYVRSRGSLDDIWRHFRKFTRVRDESGKWYYFRFWEPLLLPIFCDCKKDDADFIGNFVPEGEIITFDITLSKALVMKRNEGFVFNRNYSFKLKGDDFHYLRRFKIARDSRTLSQKVQKASGNWSSQNGIRLEECVARIEEAMTSAKEAGFSSKEHIAKFIHLCEAMNETIKQNSNYPKIRKTLSAEHSDGRRITNLEYDVKEILEGNRTNV